MKSILKLAFVLLTVIISFNALAATKKTAPKAKLGTSFKFDATTLRGKHLSAFGTNATVENDKYLDDLLAGRKNFNDRRQEDLNRN